MSRKIKKISWKEFIELFDPDIRDKIKNNRKKDGVDGIAALQCEVFDSSRFGLMTALIYGPECTFKSVSQMLIPQGVYTTGLPSSASFVKYYTEDMPI